MFVEKTTGSVPVAKRSYGLKRRYEGPVEGLTAVFEIGTDFAQVMLNGPLIGFLIAGGVVTGLVSEWVSRRLS